MQTVLLLLRNLFNNLGYVAIISIILSKNRAFKKFMIKEQFSNGDYLILSMIFGGLGILGTYMGVNIEGAIANTRIMPVIAGGILCGPVVGVTSGIIAGLHRFLINPTGVTTIQCTIITILGGIAGGYIYKHYSESKYKLWVSFMAVIILETIEMIAIIAFTKNIDLAYNIVRSIYLPMSLANGIGVVIVILIVEDTFKERERIAARRAKISLDIANKTLPYFRHGHDAYKMICSAIKDSIECDAVSITNKQNIVSYVGKGSDFYETGTPIRNEITKEVIRTKTIRVLKANDHISDNKNVTMKSGIIVPILDENEVLGTLKIFYEKNNMITEWIYFLAEGLSQILASQIGVMKSRELERTAAKAELKALQYQINPHFLFNALNTISCFVRTKPEEARELIISLSDYMRYNLESDEEFVDIYKEVEQIKDYVKIELARFSDRISMEYDIDDNLDLKIPPLIIQPIVENAFKHGILKAERAGIVKLQIKLDGEKIKVSVTDNGVGMNEKIIRSIREGTLSKEHIGLYNVNNRLDLIYNTTLMIERLEPGTRVYFCIERGMKNEVYNS